MRPQMTSPSFLKLTKHTFFDGMFQIELKTNERVFVREQIYAEHSFEQMFPQLSNKISLFSQYTSSRTYYTTMDYTTVD